MKRDLSSIDRQSSKVSKADRDGKLKQLEEALVEIRRKIDDEKEESVILHELPKVINEYKEEIKSKYLADTVINVLIQVIDSTMLPNNEDTMWLLKAQIRLRIQLQTLIAAFPERYTKRFAKKQERDYPQDFLFQDIVRIFSLASFRTGSTTTSFRKLFTDFIFVEWFKNPLYQPILHKLLQYFEIPHPYDKRKPVAESTLSPMRQQRRRNKPSAPLTTTHEPPTPKQTDHSQSSIPTKVSLVASSKNSLTNRSKFVGSHFNTNLSNTASLFRSVKLHRQPEKTIYNSQSQRMPCPAPILHPRRKTNRVLETPMPTKKRNVTFSPHTKSSASIVARAFREFESHKR